MLVRDLMTANPAVCTEETSLVDCATLMLRHDCGEVPVVDSESNMKPVGVITDRDIVIRTLARGRDPMNCVVRDCYSTPPIVVTKDMTLEDCCEIMARHQVRRLPVVDETGRCCGIVSQADVALASSESDAGEVVKNLSIPGKFSSTTQIDPRSLQ